MPGQSRVLGNVACLILAVFPAAAQEISVRVMPPDRAQLLRDQKFDIRVEAIATNPAGVIDSLTVRVDGADVTGRGRSDSPSASVKNWILRDVQLPTAGPRSIAASAKGSLGKVPLYGFASSSVTIRDWNTAPPAASGGHRARNVILLIGDGMGVAQRTAGRILARGYTQGKANGTLAMDRFPFNGLVMTSSLNSLITDSAPGATVYAAGNKTNNGMEGVFPDNTLPDDDNPRIENLSEWLTRNFGMVTGIVSDADITDATPAAFLAHTQDRDDGTLIASQYADGLAATNLKVLLGGGSRYFVPKATAGSARKDDRDIAAEFQRAGFAFVRTATQLRAYAPGADAKLLGLFHTGNMNVAFDKLRLGDPAIAAAFPDQPFLKDMASRAIDVLKQYPQGFFLMVEGAQIDKEAHRMDAERSIYDVIQFDQAVEAALDFATATNTDADPDNDTLVIVTADHETAGMSIVGVARPDKRGTRDYVKTYAYPASGNDSAVANFTDYVDADGDGYPDNPAAAHKLIVNFGAASDHYEDWEPSPGLGDRCVIQNGVAMANPADPKATSGRLIEGVVENGSAGGSAERNAVHTATDVPISAYGPGASQFARVMDNTETFFSIVQSVLGTYPVPPQF